VDNWHIVALNVLLWGALAVLAWRDYGRRK